MMYHGTLTAIYGLDIAIEAFSTAHTEMPEAEIWILGSGTESQALAELVERRGLTSKVRLVGQVASAEIPAWLVRADAGILPIRRDVFLDFAFPNKLPEFIVMGKAVISSRLKAIRHYFTENAITYFEPNDAVDLGRQMVRLYRDRALCRSQAARAREEYAGIRWDLMKQRYLKLVNKLADRGPGASEPASVSKPTILIRPSHE
jgi:glycosyltransferase involved in cell wall biosynthesis